MKINKKILVDKLRLKLKMQKDTAFLIIDGLFEILLQELIDGNSVILGNIGVLKHLMRAERVGVNPITKERLIIPSKNRIKLMQSKFLKNSLDKIA